jgi:ABC-type branched-subunit amino acid transport system ATPase component
MQPEVSHTFQQHNAGALDVIGLTKRYGSHVAIQDAGFSVLPGEVLGIIGPNGAGKTTLLEAIAGICDDWRDSLAWHAATSPARRDLLSPRRRAALR